MSNNLKIFITIFLSIFVTTIGVGLVIPLLPIYAHELGAGAFQIGLVFGAFSLTRSIFVPYFGKLSDRKRKKPILTSGLFLYFLFSILYCFSKSVHTLVLLRLGQGVASAMILPVAQSYVGMITPRQKEGQVMGLFNLSLYGGLSAGPLLGGFIKDLFNIQASFLSMSSLILFGFLICLVLLPSEDPANKSLQQTREKPASYLVLMKDPAIFSLFTFRTCFTICIGIIWTFLPFLASTKLELSSSAIGVVVMMNIFLAGLLQAPMGYLADRFSKKFFVITGGILAVVSVGYISEAHSFTALIVANGLLGLSGGISLPAIMALGVIEGRRTQAMGSLMGLLALSHSLGMLIGPLLAGMLIDLFSIGTMFIIGAFILGTGTIVFFKYNCSNTIEAL